MERERQMKRLSFTAKVAAAAMLSGVAGSEAPGVANAQAIDGAQSLFVLGDSLSDTGNAAAVVDYLLGQPRYPDATIGLCHPVERLLFDRDCSNILYERTRVSDGPVAVEHLAAHLGAAPFDPSFHTVPDRPVVGVNYAVAGAKSRDATPRDLPHQVDRLMLDHGPLLPAGTAVVLMIGGNDAIDALQAAALPELEDPAEDIGEPIDSPPDSPPEIAPPDGSGPGEPGPIITGAIDGIVAATTRLLDASASCVLVANVPNLELLPAVRDTAQANGIDEAAAIAAAEEVTTGFNTALHERLATLATAHPAGASLVPFDLHARFSEALHEAALAGSNVADACFDSERYTASMAGARYFHPDCAPAPGEAPGFDRFFFWDGIHPTGVAHAALGAALIEAYETGCPAAAGAGAIGARRPP